MKYNVLGNTGVVVSQLSLGTMTFGSAGRFAVMGSLQQDAVNELVKQAVDAGINSIDTANMYSLGQSEQFLGNAIKELELDREKLFIATKVLGQMDEDVNQTGLSRYHIMSSVDASLKRLQLDHLDLLYVHGVDPFTPIENIVHTLHDLVNSGKVRYVGVCNWPAWMVMKAIGIAEKNGWHKFSVMQYYYSAAGRDIENDILPLAQDQGLAVFPWSPLAGGFLSGKFTRQNESTGGDSRRDNLDFPPVNKELAYDIIDVMGEIAKSKDVSVAEIALAWVRHQKGITSTLIGAKRPEQLAQNIHSLELEFSTEELNAIAEASKTPKPYPNWMVERQSKYRNLDN